MAQQVKLPDMGEGVESATVVGILVEVGDEIEVDQGIVELETDKAVAEVPSPKAGTVKEIHVEQDQEVKKGDLLLTLEGDGGDEEEEAPEEEEKEEEEEEEEEPSAAEKPEKEKKRKKQEPEEQEKPREGEAEEDKEAEKEEPREEKKETPEPSGRPGDGKTALGDIPAAPHVRGLARDLGVDLRQVSGSGEGGWITEQDVKDAARETGAGGQDGQADQWGKVRREKMSKIRRTIAGKMAESHEQVARVTNFADADITRLEAFRAEHKEDFAADGIKLTLLPFVVRAVVDAMKSHPAVNASLDMDAGEIVYKEYVSISIAVDSERGLLAPVLRNVDCMSIAEVALGVQKLAEKVRGGDFGVEDLRGGTFTITNLGSIGGRYATPIVNVPESAILLTGRSEQRPVVRDGEVAIRTILPLSLSYDHRLIDGAAAARFLNDVIAFLEDPARLLTR